MPDPTLATISASQAAALDNVSPYLTRWMLHRHFADGIDIEPHSDNRMDWGLRMEPLILAEASRELALEVRPNTDQLYVRSGQFGCTRDAEIIAPDIGPGALESKCVFDFRDWMSDWGGGTAMPKHYEIQLQAQMMVGDGSTPYEWGVVAVWVAGEVHYFRRAPIPALWDHLRAEGAKFFEDVEGGHAPDPFGSPKELPFLTSVIRKGPVDLSSDPHAIEIAETARTYDWARKQRLMSEKIEDKAKTALLFAMGDAEEAALFGGIKVKAKSTEIGEAVVTRKAHVQTRVTVTIPAVLPDVLLDEI